MRICSKCNVEKSDSDFYSYKKSCKDCVKAASSARYREKRDVVLATQRKYYELNKEKKIADVGRYQKENNGRVNAKNMKRYASKLRATPPWLTKDHSLEMQEFYIRAVESGMHVDHIIPLQGKNVCGLHVPWNLQLLDPVENLRKGNSYED